MQIVKESFTAMVDNSIEFLPGAQQPHSFLFQRFMAPLLRRRGPLLRRLPPHLIIECRWLFAA